jgi:phosphoribosylglycinamide formyltransferase 2
VIAMTDGAELRRVITEEKPHYIVPELEAIATPVLLELEAEGFRVIPTARAARLTMDREGIRRLAAEALGIPTSRYAFASDRAEYRDAVQTIGLPCVVKPIMSSSGKGQSVVHATQDASAVEAAYDYAQEHGRTGGGKVIVEALFDFDYEITILTVRHAGGTSFCAPIGHRQVHGDYHESWQPQPMPAPVLRESERIAERVTSELGGRGIFGVELFVKGETVLFSEVSPRPHDTGMVTMATQVWSEFALHARAILGLPISAIRRHSAGASVALRAERALASPVIEGLDQAYAQTDVDVRWFGKPNAGPRRRMGVVLATADTAQAALAKATQVAAGITLRDA